MTLASLRWILAAALAAPMFTSCGAAPKVVRATATDTPSTAMDRPGAARTPGDAFSLPRRQDDDVPFRQIHPNTMVTVSGLIGSADVEINAGPPTGIVSGSADAYGGRLRGEHIFGDSNIGAHLSYTATQSDDLDPSPTTKTTASTSTLFFGVTYRALMDDDFRLPVRVGPLLHVGTFDPENAPDGDTTYSLTGVRLAAEPEFIVLMHKAGGRVRSELSVFTEIACGTGSFEAKDDVDEESGYAFQFHAELGLRYRFAGGFLAGLSYMMQKSHFGATESYNNTNTVFNGIDDDVSGVMVTLGARF
ncbi:MAG: hypothetical protein ACK5AL_04285 [Planctomycetota bacterium]|jgi:hypothetical protein